MTKIFGHFGHFMTKIFFLPKMNKMHFNVLTALAITKGFCYFHDLFTLKVDENATTSALS